MCSSFGPSFWKFPDANWYPPNQRFCLQKGLWFSCEQAGVQLSPRMGQHHPSPGQSFATERREAPPWVLQYPQALPCRGVPKCWSNHRLLVRPLQGNLRRLRGIPRASLRFALGYDVIARWARFEGGATDRRFIILFTLADPSVS